MLHRRIFRERDETARNRVADCNLIARFQRRQSSPAKRRLCLAAVVTQRPHISRNFGHLIGGQIDAAFGWHWTTGILWHCHAFGYGCGEASDPAIGPQEGRPRQRWPRRTAMAVRSMTPAARAAFDFADKYASADVDIRCGKAGGQGRTASRPSACRNCACR